MIIERTVTVAGVSKQTTNGVAPCDWSLGQRYLMSLVSYHERSSFPNDKIIRLLSSCPSKLCPFAAAKSHQAIIIQGPVAQTRQVFSKKLTCRSPKIIPRNMHSISIGGTSSSNIYGRRNVVGSLATVKHMVYTDS